MSADTQADVIVVTGSSGLIGRAVVSRVAPRFRVVGFDREGWPHPPREAECVCVDLTSDASVKAGFERVRYGYGDRIASVMEGAVREWSTSAESEWARPRCGRGGEGWANGDGGADRVVWAAERRGHSGSRPGREVVLPPGTWPAGSMTSRGPIERSSRSVRETRAKASSAAQATAPAVPAEGLCAAFRASAAAGEVLLGGVRGRGPGVVAVEGSSGL